MNKINAIIFDLGNVVFPINTNRIFEYWSSVSGISTSELKTRLQLEHEIHYQFERGEITEYEFREYISKTIGYPLTIEEFKIGWNSLYEDVFEGFEELIDSLADYKIIALSNSNKTHQQVWQVRYKTILDKFDHVFSSNDIGCRKPEKPSYQVCIDAAGLPAKQIVFLDDKVENTRGAEECGMHTIIVSSYAQMKRELAGLLNN